MNPKYVWYDRTGDTSSHFHLPENSAIYDKRAGHSQPRTSLAGVGVNLSVALTTSITLVAGFGYGIDAPRNGGFGGREVDAQFQLKY